MTCIEGVRPAGEGNVHTLEAVGFHAAGKAQAAGQFLGQHDLGVIAHDHVDFVLLGIEVVEQLLGVQGAAGAGNGDEDFHGRGWLRRFDMQRA
jgi:hypothetical protein